MEFDFEKSLEGIQERYNNLFKGVSWVVASSIIGSVLQFLLIFVLLNFYKQENHHEVFLLPLLRRIFFII